MDTAHWPQEFGVVKSVQELKPPTTASNNCTNTTIPTTRPQVQAVERKERPQKERAINCPRCNSTNTKFCYYNNYSLTQPRYFCKACRRYWTEGGSLRNVPVGGGSRKNKRTSSTTTTTATASTTVMTSSVGIDKKLPSHELIAPKLMYEGQDLNLSFPYNGNSNNNSNNLAFPFPRASGLGGFMQMGTPGMSDYSATFGMQEFRPAGGLSFTLDGNGGGQNGRLLFPYEDMKPVVPASSAGFDQFEQNRGQTGDVPGYWNGMIGGGGSWVG